MSGGAKSSRLGPGGSRRGRTRNRDRPIRGTILGRERWLHAQEAVRWTGGTNRLSAELPQPERPGAEPASRRESQDSPTRAWRLPRRENRREVGPGLYPRERARTSSAPRTTARNRDM